MRTKGLLLTGLVSVMAAIVLCLSWSAPVVAQTNWADEISNALTFYKASYPSANWDPYVRKITVVREALGHGDQGVVKKEMGTFFKMLRTRAHDISDVPADELYNFAVMVTPLQEYGISLPASTSSQ